MNAPAVSAVIPLYNKGALIGQTVASALAQTFSDLEIIIVDDGSSDDGFARVQEIRDPRITLIQQTNSGVAAARNHGMKEARAPFVAFLDADDLWRRDHLVQLIELTRRYPEAVLFANRFVEFRGGHPPAPVAPEPINYTLLNDYFSTCAISGQPFFTSSCMVKRPEAIAAGGFPAGHSRGEDLALWMKLAAVAPVAVSNYVGCFYRRTPDALTAQCVTAPDVSMTTLEELIAGHDDWPPSRRNGAREFYNRIALAHAIDCARAGDAATAKQFVELSAGTATLRQRWWYARLLVGMPRALRNMVFSFIEWLRGARTANLR